MRLKIMLVLSLIFLVTANAQSTENQLRCEETAACTCFDYNEIEIQCPKFEPHVIVRIQPNNYVHFECENMTGNEYELVPHYELDTAAFLQITKCTLLDGKSIMDTYLKNFKFNRIRNFQFVSSGANKHVNFQQSHFRGLGNVERFDLRGNEDEIAELPEDLFVDMKNLSWVRIRVAKIYLPDNLFAPLDKLEFLELGHNKLETLPNGFLRNQKKLVQLNLWGNSLKNLKKDSFVGLNLVKELDLSGNKMESLESDVLYHLTNLTDINLSGNNFAALPDDLFQNNRKLKYVRLLENRVPMNTLPKGLFANLTELTHVSLKADLQTLPEDIFEGSYNILQLKLDKNLLNNLPAGLLYHQVNLEKLDLQDNLIESLADSFFSKTTSLKELYLSGNLLTTVNEKIFNQLTKLTQLYMNNNLLTTLDSRAFSKTPMLEYITLENNNISFKTFPASPFQMLQKLEKLDLANNSINFVFEDFTLISLKLLNLSYNKIDMLSTSQLNNIKTSEIDLTYNEIMEINVDYDVNEQITVRLNHNPLACDCRVHNFVKYLKKRNNDITNQRIRLITDDLRCAEPEKLADLNVSDIDPFDLICSLDSKDTKVPKCPKDCNCLRRPEDSHILLECTSDLVFASLPVLESHLLELSIVPGNSTLELPIVLPSADSKTKSGYEMVTNLTISNNQISEILLENLPPELRVLDVRNNSLDTFNETVRDFLRPNVTLFLGGNPWRCDCTNKGFIDFVQMMIHGNNVTDPNDIKCKNGQDLLRDVYLPKLCKENENMLIIILCIITAIMGIGFGGFAALYYKYQKQIKMWLYSHNMLLWFVTEEELDKDKRYDAFVSYSHRDNDFVADHLLPELENGTIPYKLCVHERDWHPGLEISTQISNSVNDAKRTIIVMSPNYLQSNWAQWEFRVAQSHAATEKRSRIIVILYGDIGDINKLEPDIRDYLKLNTYVKWGDKWFWEKLKYAMPHVKSSERLERGNGLVKSAMKSSVDDKLELIKPISVTPPMLTTPPAEKVANPLIAKLNAKNAANLNGKAHNGYNGHINGAYVINTSSRQSDV